MPAICYFTVTVTEHCNVPAGFKNIYMFWYYEQIELFKEVEWFFQKSICVLILCNSQTSK